MKAICCTAFLLALGACGDNSSTGVDAGDASADAAAPAKACTSSTTLELPAGAPYAAVSDGTTVYVALTTTPADQLYAIPLAGGSATLVATASEGKFALAAAGTAVFYAAKLGGADYAVHQRAGTADTLLGTIASTSPLLIAANSSDVYTAGSGGTGVEIQSLSRTGPSNQVPGNVATSSGSALRLVLGSTIVAWLDTETPAAWRVTPVANPGSVTSITAPNGGPVQVAGDVAIALAGMIQTSHTTSYTWSVIYPATEVIRSGSQTGQWFEMRGADATHVFVAETYRPDPALYATEKRLWSYGLDGTHHFAGQTELCNYAPTLVGQDATYLFAVEEPTAGTFSLVAIPIP